jgi:hypothetical protein
MQSNLLDIWNLNSLWRLLSSINSGDKLSIHGDLITIDKNTTLLCIKRKYYGDKRCDVFHFLDNLIIITVYHFKEKTNINKNVDSFKQNILLGLKGLLNLRETYLDDARFLSLYNSELEKIKQFKKYFNENNEDNQFINIESQIYFINNAIMEESYIDNN